MKTWAEQLEDMLDSIEEIESESEGEGWLAVSNKLLEVRGPLSSAIAAARQYEFGEIEPRFPW